MHPARPPDGQRLSVFRRHAEGQREPPFDPRRVQRGDLREPQARSVRYVKRPHAERRPDALAVVKQPVRVCFPKGQKPQLRRYRRGADQQRRGQRGDKPPPHAATGCRRVRQRGKHLRKPGTSFGRTFPCGQHAHGAVKCSVIHRQSPSFSRISLRRRRPRLRREAAVPRGTPSTAAISSSG